MISSKLKRTGQFLKDLRRVQKYMTREDLYHVFINTSNASLALNRKELQALIDDTKTRLRILLRK